MFRKSFVFGAVVLSVVLCGTPEIVWAQSSTVARATKAGSSNPDVPKADPDDVAAIRQQAEELVRSQREALGAPSLGTTNDMRAAARTSADLYSMKPAPFAPENIPALANFMKIGGKFYYMGERSGLYGWFVIKDGQIQMIYVSADMKTVFIGAMFSEKGENITSPQIAKLAEADKDVAMVLNTAANEQKEVTAAGAVVGGAAVIPGSTSAEVPKDDLKNKTIASLIPPMPASPGERLLMDLKSSAHATAGKNEKNVIYMVVDPRCPHCKDTWRELAPSIREGKISVAIIPITMGDSTSEDSQIAANLLRAKDPLDAWDKYVNGDKSALVGEADAAQIRSLFSNRFLVDRWNIKATPYLTYRAKNGQIKIVQGRPERMAVVLGDLAE